MGKTNQNIDIKTSDIKAILEDVQKSLSLQAAEKLVKAAEESSPADAPSEAPEASSAAPADESAEASAPPDTAAVDAPSAPPDASASPEGQDPAADQTMSPEQLAAEYAALPDDVLQAHYMACKQALLSRAAPAPQVPAASPAPAPMMGKGEMPAGKEMEVPKTSAKQPIEAEVAMKSEIEALKNQNAELSKGVDGLAKVLTNFISKPQRKAVTNMNYVERVAGETKPAGKALSKKEVQENVRGRLGGMSPTDRSKLLDFYENKLSFEKIAHLMKD